MRTHDLLYLDENRFDEPKESFKFCLALAKDYGFLGDGPVYDFGCAAGEFCYFLRDELPKSQIYGVDILPELVARARLWVNDVLFLEGSVLARDRVVENSAALSFLIGVHSIFDDPLPAFDNLIYWTRPGGIIVIFGLFNRYPVDTFVKVRAAGHADDHRESGWNMISQQRVGEFLKNHKKVKKYHFHEFNINLDIPQHADDALRSWTFKTHDSKRLIMNGTGLLHDFHALVLELW